jgi:catechol 2,3-dioxygenase-like lactoylglutathione lyase family enzyme
MAMSRRPVVQRLSRFSLTTVDAERSATFFEDAFGCRRLSTERLSGVGFEALMGVRGGALRTTLSLGEQIVELLQFDQRGQPYPDKRSASDLFFQHFAIAVRDMADACRQLNTVAGWTQISRGGPQCLPASSGGVAAFKFRDPEGHPLELLAFPRDAMPENWQSNAERSLFHGIDHSAISVSNTARSASFYENLGLAVCTRTLNEGPGQDALDGLTNVRVNVTALALRQPEPHLELLGYSTTAPRANLIRSNADIATTRLVFSVTGASASYELVDPDGHRLLIEGE